jgi:hypothetical protein
LEEPMRQLMREMEKEMEVSYLDDVNDEDGYYVERQSEICREPIDNDRDVSALASTDLRGKREPSTVGTSSSYASVQASIQHAIFCYKNQTLASSEA